MIDITAEYVRTILDYNPETGVFVWKSSVNRNGNYVGRRAGCIHGQGYIVISIGNVQQQAHRLAWLHYYGCWPNGEIDHKDTDRSNNAIANLREASRPQNNFNRRVSPKNKAGIKGVRLNKNRWEAAIWVGNRSVYLGRFDTAEDAAAAYRYAAEREFGEFARFE